jgi:spermidine synthase
MPTPEPATAPAHVQPYIHETLTTRALHFNIHEMQSRMDLQRPDALDVEYTRTMMGFVLFKPAPAAIAMIGLGGGSLVKFCHRHLPRSDISVVEINPHVIALRDRFQVPPDSERLRVIQGDGADFVRTSAQRFDVLLVDGFDSEGLPDRLCSQRFYDDCMDMLLPGGLLVVNLHFGHPRLPSLVECVRRSAHGAALVVDDEECTNSIVFARKGQMLATPRTGAVRRPRGFDAAAWASLHRAFARIVLSLKEETP